MEQKIEENVIGSLILKPKFFKEVSEVITEKDFKIDLFKHAYKTINSMVEKNLDIEITSLYLEMGRPETASILARSLDDVIFDPTYYAMQLRKRNLEDEIKRTAGEREFEKTKEQIREIENLGKPASLYNIQKMIETKENFQEHFKTGYEDLDYYVKFRPTDLLIIAGKPSTGKSSFGFSILGNMAERYPVGLISFEMSLNAIANRLSSMYDFEYLNKINQNFQVSSPSVFSLQETRKSIRKLVNEMKSKVIMVDYLQIMQEARRFESRRLEITAIIRGLKELAKEFGVGMIVVSSLSRQVDHRGENSRPQMSDLRESGDIEYASDIILFLNPTKDKKTELIIDKNRHGKAKKIINLIWLEDKISYGSWEWKEE